MKSPYTLAATVLFTAVIWTQPGAAQDAVLEEIIVTAQNREESVQDVPIAMEVFSADQLRDAGFSDLKDIERISSSVQIKDDQGALHVTVRGIGTNSADEAQDTSVVVNIDGEYLNRPRVMNMAIFDLERVEVLKGPQGTLYGRNSTGGAVNFITRKPGDELAINLTATAGSYGTQDIDAGMDLPLGDNASVRFAAFSKQHDGFFSHPNADVDSGNNDMAGGRISLRFEPSDVLAVDLAIETAERDFSPPVFATADLHQPENEPGPNCSNPGFERIAPNYSEVLCIPSSTNFQSGIDPQSYAAPLFGVGGFDQDGNYIHNYAALLRLIHPLSVKQASKCS